MRIEMLGHLRFLPSQGSRPRRFPEPRPVTGREVVGARNRAVVQRSSRHFGWRAASLVLAREREPVESRQFATDQFEPSTVTIVMAGYS